MQKLKKINFKKIFCLAIFAFLIFAPRAARAAFTTVSLTAPLRCVGSGTTKICDYIDFKNQQVVRNVGYIASYAGQTVGSVSQSPAGDENLPHHNAIRKY